MARIFGLPRFGTESNVEMLIFAGIIREETSMGSGVVIKKFILLLIAVVCIAGLPLSASAQGFVIDTTEFFLSADTTVAGPFLYNYDQLYEDEITEEEVAEIENTEPDSLDMYLPAESIFVPSDIVSSARWDTLYIRTTRTDFSKLEEPRTIVLKNPEESDFCFPFRGKLISPYGPRGRRFHAGADIKLETGDTVHVAFSGKVRIARVMSGYGKMVVVRHNNGLETVYAHLSRILVNVNQELKAGEVIGLGGRTGRATTSHLHFETRYMGEHFNPNRILNFDNFCLAADTLIIDKDFFSRKKSTPKPAASEPGQAGDETQSQVTKKYHTIRSGDTLYGISLRYKTTVAKICKLNGISENKKLQIGARLRVK